MPGTFAIDGSGAESTSELEQSKKPAVLALIADEVGHSIRIRTMPRVVMRALGFPSSTATNPLATAVHDIIAWYQTHGSTP